MPTPIESFEDILEVLEHNPALRDALRRHILSQELLQLPVQLGQFITEQRAFNEGMNDFREEQRAFNQGMNDFREEQRAFNQGMNDFREEQRAFNQGMNDFREGMEERTSNILTRLDRMEADSGIFKGYVARNGALSEARGIAQDLGLAFVRTLTPGDLAEIAGNQLDRDTGRSFRRADLVIEATRDGTPEYIVLEVSYTADQRDSDRALRNARLLTEFTGRPATAGVASIRNTREIEQLVASGTLHWYPLEDRTPAPE